MNVIYTILAVWFGCAVLNFFTLWLYNQAHLANKRWGVASKPTDMLSAFACGPLGTLLIGGGLASDLWSKRVGPCLTKQVLFKKKPAEYPAKGAKCAKPGEYYTYGVRSDRV